MANPVWPASLPQTPLRDGFVEELADTTLRTEMDAGPAKVRRRFQAGVATMSVQMFLTKAQVATFETFYKTTLEGGALRFGFPDPRSGTAKDVRIVPRPSLSEIKADTWRLTLQLELLP